jgi:CDGSH-type Zn-finger protein
MTDTCQVQAAGGCFHCISSTRIEVISSPDGPLLVRGALQVTDQDGTSYLIQRPVVALCRCGTSTHGPWCDGMHKLLQRRDNAEDTRRPPA